MPFDAVLFDLDDTLVEYERDHTRVCVLPGALDALDAVSNYQVGVVTNGDRGMQ